MSILNKINDFQSKQPHKFDIFLKEVDVNKIVTKYPSGRINSTEISKKLYNFLIKKMKITLSDIMKFSVTSGFELLIDFAEKKGDFSIIKNFNYVARFVVLDIKNRNQSRLNELTEEDLFFLSELISSYEKNVIKMKEHFSKEDFEKMQSEISQVLSIKKAS